MSLSLGPDLADIDSFITFCVAYFVYLRNKYIVYITELLLSLVWVADIYDMDVKDLWTVWV